MTKDIKTNELENVSGGTVNELADLVRAVSNGSDYAASSAHAPAFNKVEACMIKDRLRDLGIKADISIGLVGTGFLSSPNTYTNIATGEKMSHIEVLSVLQAKG